MRAAPTLREDRDSMRKVTVGAAWGGVFRALI